MHSLPVSVYNPLQYSFIVRELISIFSVQPYFKTTPTNLQLQKNSTSTNHLDPLKQIFPLNPAEANTRGKQKYFVSHANTGRYMDSPVP